MAPLALAAAATATYLIVHHAMEHKHASPPAPIVQTTSTRARTSGHATAKSKFYVVQPNDTLSKISAKTGVSLGTLEELNPSINPDALHPTQRLRLRP